MSSTRGIHLCRYLSCAPGRKEAVPASVTRQGENSAQCTSCWTLCVAVLFRDASAVHAGMLKNKPKIDAAPPPPGANELA